MSINYYVIPKENPLKEGDTKYYAAAKMKGHIDQEELCQAIAQECTVTEHDVKAILSALQQHIIQKLLQNQSVRLGDLGSFHIKTNCEGVEDPDELSTDNLKAVKVHFRKSARMLREMAVDECKFNKITD